MAFGCAVIALTATLSYSATCADLGFSTGEGLGIAWPGQDLALLFAAVVFLAAGLMGSSLARKLSMEFA